jgi:hypothetical protein
MDDQQLFEDERFLEPVNALRKDGRSEIMDGIEN